MLGKSLIAKRCLDIAVGLMGIVAFLPLGLLIALTIFLRYGSPVFYVQVRPGISGRPFRIVKFRTMTEECDKDGQLLSDESRLTGFGKLLRETSLDELPELWNVLKGEMSLVGPRPLLLQYLSLYNSRQARRHEVKPGITGWAQVNGRNAIHWDEKLELDVWYVENRSMVLDLKILVITLWKVLRREGISAPGHATADYFRGSSSTDTGPRCSEENKQDRLKCTQEQPTN